MASIKEAFGEYKPNKSKVYFDAPVSLGELLDRLAAGGVPMTHTLSEFHKNPEGPISETAQVFTDEIVPFKYQIRSGEATPTSLAKEAVMLAAPMRGKREYKVDPKRTAEFKEMVNREWHKVVDDPMSDKYKALEALSMSEYGHKPRGINYYKTNWPQFEPYLDNVIYRGVDPLTNTVNQHRAKTLGEEKFGDYLDLRVDNPDNIVNADLNGKYIFEDNPNLSIILSNPKYRAKLYDLVKKAKSNDELRKVLNLEANNLYTEMLLDDLD